MSTNAAAAYNPTFRRRGAWWLRYGGLGVAAGGGLLLLGGGVLPWAAFEIFGVPITIPGVMTIGGMVTSGIGLLALSLLSRRWFPLVGITLGFCALGTGLWAQQATGRDVRRFMLEWETTLAPVNARLAQAALPPIEPFSGIGPPAQYAGPGIGLSLWGAFVLSVGSAGAWVGERMRRSCGKCGLVWNASRNVAFCPGAEPLPESRPPRAVRRVTPRCIKTTTFARRVERRRRHQRRFRTLWVPGERAGRCGAVFSRHAVQSAGRAHG